MCLLRVFKGTVSDEDLPKVLIAITAIKQRADLALEDIYNMLEIMRKTKYILSNIIVIHRNILQNSVIALKRIERLSDHLETYRKIVANITYEMDIKTHLNVFLKQIRLIRELNDTFGEFWHKNEQRIGESIDIFDENYRQIGEHKTTAEELLAKRDFFKVVDLSILCKHDYKYCKDLDQTCNEWCRESGDQCSDICTKVNQLENTFNDILKQSLDSMQINRHKTCSHSQSDCDHQNCN